MPVLIKGSPYSSGWRKSHLISSLHWAMTPPTRTCSRFYRHGLHPFTSAPSQLALDLIFTTQAKSSNYWKSWFRYPSEAKLKNNAAPFLNRTSNCNNRESNRVPAWFRLQKFRYRARLVAATGTERVGSSDHQRTAAYT